MGAPTAASNTEADVDVGGGDGDAVEIAAMRKKDKKNKKRMAGEFVVWVDACGCVEFTLAMAVWCCSLLVGVKAAAGAGGDDEYERANDRATGAPESLSFHFGVDCMKCGSSADKLMLCGVHRALTQVGLGPAYASDDTEGIRDLLRQMGTRPSPVFTACSGAYSCNSACCCAQRMSSKSWTQNALLECSPVGR